MGTGRIAPTAVVIGESVVRGTEVGSSDGDGSSLETPLRHFGCITNNLIASPA